jgi:hypothetical protein
MPFLSFFLALSAPWSGQWPIPASTGGVLENLDRVPVVQTATPGEGVAPAIPSQMAITISARSRLDVTVICRTRGEFFNHDLPGGQPDPSRPGSQCAQMVGEKGSERIEDTTSRRKREGS